MWVILKVTQTLKAYHIGQSHEHRCRTDKPRLLIRTNLVSEHRILARPKDATLYSELRRHTQQLCILYIRNQVRPGSANHRINSPLRPDYDVTVMTVNVTSRYYWNDVQNGGGGSLLMHSITALPDTNWSSRYSCNSAYRGVKQYSPPILFHIQSGWFTPKQYSSHILVEGIGTLVQHPTVKSVRESSSGTGTFQTSAHLKTNLLTNSQPCDQPS